ncbi:MAG: Fur family transcriptional regulator [Armatimonadota bacterium]
MTRQRRVVLEELRKSKAHPTADEVYARVRRRLLKISLGTVYRNLEVLSGLGAIQTLDLGGARHYDGNPEAHCHVRCSGCGRVADLPESPIVPLAGGGGYDITGYRLTFTGYCPSCKNE